MAYIRIISKLVMCLSTNGEPNDYTIFMILTSNTEATENKVQFLNFAYTVKGFECHSNNSLQLFELKEKQQQQNNTHYLKVFFVIFFS